MKTTITSAKDLGLLVRAVRKSAAVRQDDLAAIAGVSRQFAIDVEKGKPTVQLGRVLLLLDELGIALTADIPDETATTLEQLRKKPRAARASPHAGQDPGRE
jgi:y4mF family transcriptional regulator